MGSLDWQDVSDDAETGSETGTGSVWFAVSVGLLGVIIGYLIGTY